MSHSSKKFHCENRIIWISGGTKGIGAALVAELIAKGNTLYITARSKDALNALEASHPNQVTGLVGDITDLTTMKQHAQIIQEQQGKLDLLILNAGTAEYLDTNKFDSQLFKRVMDVNFLGSMHHLEAALPLLRLSQTRTIVGIGSCAAYTPFSRAEAYGASKAALHYCLNSLRVDLADEGFHVCVVAPGFVKTPLTDKNDFPMPMLLSADVAAQKIIEGIERQKQQVRFPTVFTGFIGLIGGLPSQMRHNIMLKFRKNSENGTQTDGDSA